MKVAFSTLGCRVNQYEAEAMIERFLHEGYELVPFNETADVYVINTCTVTNMGDKKSRQMISRARRQNEISIIAVVGCYSQIAPDEVSNIDGVDIVLGTRNKNDIVYWVNRFKEEKKKVVQVKDVLKNNEFEDLNIEEYQNKTRAFLKIQDGCDRFCSYCLIPFARGAVCSKPHELVLEEIKKLARNGFKEIILSGIHTASYGKDFKEKYNLLDLLNDIEAIEGITRVRIGSIDPTFFSEDTIFKLKGLNKLCPHFHLSLQSGCNDTLKRMNRHYTKEEYEKIVNELRENIPGVSLTTDIIVGFPGETEEEFEESYDFLKKIKLTKMHIFKYSPRKGTKAAGMVNQVEGSIKEQRSDLLLKLSMKYHKEFMEKFKGNEAEVLFEQKSEDSNFYEGYTSNYIRVLAASEQNIIGKCVKVKFNQINKVDEESFIATIN